LHEKKLYSNQHMTEMRRGRKKRETVRKKERREEDLII